MLKEQMVLPVGATVRDNRGERYSVEAVLGVGGFSAVYRVRDKQTGQHVFALKEIINPDNEDRRTLSTEALLLMRLNNSSLPRVYQVFEHIKLRRIYLLMDYIEGQNLEILRGEQVNNAFPLDFTLALMSPIMKAIVYLHEQNPPIVHRDIKPANIIVPKGAGDAILVDFGLAKEYVEEKTTNVLRYGTPGYAAPEQYAQGTNLRTDVYGLGATFYTLLTGIRPIDSLIRIVSEDGKDHLKRVDQISPTISASVGKVLSRAMSLRSDNRYTTIDEFWQALSFAATHPEDAENTEEVASPDEGPDHAELETLSTTALSSEKSQKSPARRFSFTRIPLLLIAIIALIGLSSFLFFRSSGSSHQATPVVHHPLPTAVVDACAPPTVAVLPTSDYPLLNPCYSGTIDDIGVAKNKTALYFIDIQQNQDKVSGRFRGLNVIGNFQGSIRQNGDLKLIVTLAGRTDTIVLTGNSKYGGDMRGDFEVDDKNGQPTSDEYGSWYAQQSH